MANTIKIKRSTGSAAPVSLAFGELAYSSGSDKLYFGSSTDGTTVTVKEIGGAALTGYFAGVTPGTVTASKAIIVDSNKNIGDFGTVTATSFVGDVTGTVTDISNHDTDALAEGATNLYFTETRARDSLSAGTGVTYTAGTGVIAIGQAVGTTDDVTFNNVTVDGSLSSDDITATTVTVTGDAVITGNLTVQGTTTTIDSTTVAIADLNFTLAKDAANATAANGAGLTVAGADATITYASTGDKWVFNKQVEANVTGNLTGNADTATALATSHNFSASGDASAPAVSFDGSGAVDLVMTLATVLDGTTNKAPGSFGSSTAIPVVTVDAKGRVTAITTESITTSLDIAGDTGTDTIDLATDTFTVAGSGAISTAVASDTVTVSVDTASDSVLGVASFASGNFAVAAGAVSIKADGVGTTEIATAAVTTAKIDDLAVTAGKLAADSVETAKIVNDAVTTAKIADGAVTTAKIATDAVTADKMADSSVDLASATVTGTLPVANGGTGATTFTAGRLLVGDGTDPVATDAGLTWNGTTDTLVVGGASIATDNAGVVTISTTGTDADLIIAPNGTGSVTIVTDSIILDSAGDGVIESNPGETLTVRGATGLTLQATANDITMDVAAGTTAKIAVSGPTAAQYATDLGDNDLATAYWVQNVATLDGGTY